MKKQAPKQYRRYIVMLDCFAHDTNGNPIAHHSVYGTDDTNERTPEQLAAYDMGGPLLFRTRKRSQVGGSTNRDDWAGTALQKAGAPQGVRQLYQFQRVGDRSNGSMFLIYTAPGVETSQEMRRRLAGVGVDVLRRIEAGENSADVVQELVPDYADRVEFFFMLDNLHPVRLTALKMVVDAYQNKTPLPKVGGVTLF